MERHHVHGKKIEIKYQVQKSWNKKFLMLKKKKKKEKVNPKNITCELTSVSLICATQSISIMWGPTFTLNEETHRKRLASTLTIRKIQIM